MSASIPEPAAAEDEEILILGRTARRTPDGWKLSGSPIVWASYALAWDAANRFNALEDPTLAGDRRHLRLVDAACRG